MTEPAMEYTDRLKPRISKRDNVFNSTDISIETSGFDVESFNSFTDNLSPIPISAVARKLDFDSMEDEEQSSPKPGAMSPPYKRVRALRLQDSPATPKTLLEKCSTPRPRHGAPAPARMRLFPPRLAAAINKRTDHPLILPTGKDDDSAFGSLLHHEDHADDSLNVSTTRLHRPTANVNPFTPDGRLLNSKKRALSNTPGSQHGSPELPAKRLKESNISRYHEEFVERGVVGRGEFGVVTRCVHRLDGCEYALKRSLRPVAGSQAERAALNEVYAHAVLGKHPHVVRYYSAWAEDDHMIIQNEYCDRGSLQDLVQRAGPLPEPELKVLLAHVARGLKYIHSMELVHMDLKPGNIFVCSAAAAAADNDSDNDSDSADTESDDEERRHSTYNCVYKIGDLGHVTCTSAPLVEEGDSRYLPAEVLHEDYDHLPKADIFAFGLTLFEAGGGGPLPKNEQLWHEYRQGRLPDLPHCSREFNALLKRMVHPAAAERPSAAQLCRWAGGGGAGAGAGGGGGGARGEGRAHLRREVAALRLETDALKLENEVLTRRLHLLTKCLKNLTPGNADKYNTRSRRRLKPDSAVDELMKALPSNARLRPPKKT